MIPSASNNSRRILVAKADARTLTRLLTNSMVHMSSSLFLKIFSKIIAFFFPDFARVCILDLDAEVKDVSAPEKKADNNIKPKIIPSRIPIEKSITLIQFFH